MKIFLIVPSVAILTLVPSASAFGNALFQSAPTAQQTLPTNKDGVEIELPDFGELFGRIQQVSPLARVLIEGNGGNKGFEAVDPKCKRY